MVEDGWADNINKARFFDPHVCDYLDPDKSNIDDNDGGKANESAQQDVPPIMKGAHILL